MISCTVTIREKDNGEFVHEEMFDALPKKPSTKSQTFVIRAAEDLVSDSDPNYLKIRYPDLFPFSARRILVKPEKFQSPRKDSLHFTPILEGGNFRKLILFCLCKITYTEHILQQSYG